MNEQTTLMDSLVGVDADAHAGTDVGTDNEVAVAAVTPPAVQQRLDDHTRELGIQGVRNVRSILQHARQIEGHDGHQTDDLVAEPKAA